MAANLPVNPSASLPGGTVTLLFTDIEGSTRSWEEQPGAMRTALRQHDELLAQRINERGLRGVRTRSDRRLNPITGD